MSQAEAAAALADDDMETKRTGSAAERAEVIRGILNREVSGASVRANTVKREQHGLFVMAIRQYRTWGRALTAAGLDAEAISRRRKWTTERIVQAIHDLHAREVPLYDKSVATIDQGVTQAARKLLGSWDNALSAAGFDPARIRRQRRPWTKSEIITILQKQTSAGMPFVQSAMYPAGARFAVKRLFGSFSAALRIAGVLKPAAAFPRWSKAAVVAAIRERHERGQVICCTGVIADRPRLYDAARRYFGGWSHALRAAGFDPHQVRRKPTPWTAPMVLAELRRRAKAGTPAMAISFIQPVSFVRACINFFGSLEAAAAAARVDPAKIAYRRSSGRKRRRYRGGQASA